ncbi:MAG: Rv1355c family protein [Flavobacteriales bacterium]|nr:Rv1355c family protein [Flavobacteriales bacterium]
MTTWLEALRGASAADPEAFRPVLFRLAQPSDQRALEGLLKHDRRITVHDELRAQLRELVKALQPAVKWTGGQLDEAVDAHLAGIPAELYGCWVYYPWSNRLVHLLDESEFARVRTDRNRNKITAEEQAILATKRVGVIGLSVGQSVSLALAMERSFGELRLADFDALELSNLNRIRSGVHHLGVNKVVNAAREIAELDPYLKVTAFTEGVNEENIDRFLTEGGKLDLLIEECDSVAVKIIARQKAKALRIPVVMETSDRGLIDVERFDLEPDRAILHGLVEHLDLNLAAKARTNEEKLPFVVPIIGLDTMSTRMKASMLEIESTVGTWPQLAGAVMLGGALVAEIHRRIALGQFSSSGRWYIDPVDLISDPSSPEARAAVMEASAPLTSSTMHAIASKQLFTAPSREITSVEAQALVEAAIMAPSAGNLQPWRFLLSDGRLLAFHDGSLGDSALDAGRLIPSIDMGTALENIRLRAASLGFSIKVQPYPIAGEHALVASIVAENAATTPDPLADVIPLRCTNRRKGDARPMDPGASAELRDAASAVAGCDAHLITDRDALLRMAEVIGEAERLRVLNPIGHFELFEKEMRWSDAELTSNHDGLDLPSMELKLTEEVGFRVARDRKAMDLLADWDGARGFMKMTRDNFRSASGLVLVSAAASSPADLLEAGRAVQRVWLRATAMGLASHPCSAPLLLAHHVRFGGGAGISHAHRQTLLQLLSETLRAFGTEGREPIFLLRLSYAGQPTARSVRRPLSAFLQFDQQPIPA